MTNRHRLLALLRFIDMPSHHYATLSAFTDKANKIHADKYDYDCIEFPITAQVKTNKHKIQINDI